MSKLFFAIVLVFSVIVTSAFANDESLVTELSGSTIRIQFHSTVIPARSFVFELGKVTLSDGDILGCSLHFNTEPFNRTISGELLIKQAAVSLMWDSRYYYHVWGDYVFNGSKQEFKNFLEMHCYESRGFISIGNFREYLQAINGSLTLP